MLKRFARAFVHVLLILILIVLFLIIRDLYNEYAGVLILLR